MNYKNFFLLVAIIAGALAMMAGCMVSPADVEVNTACTQNKCEEGDVGWGFAMPSADLVGSHRAWTLHFAYKAVNLRPCAVDDVKLRIDIWKENTSIPDEPIRTFYISGADIDFTGALSDWYSDVAFYDYSKPDTDNWYFRAYFVSKDGYKISDLRTAYLN